MNNFTKFVALRTRVAVKHCLKASVSEREWPKWISKLSTGKFSLFFLQYTFFSSFAIEWKMKKWVKKDLLRVVCRVCANYINNDEWRGVNFSCSFMQSSFSVSEKFFSSFLPSPSFFFSPSLFFSCAYIDELRFDWKREYEKRNWCTMDIKEVSIRSIEWWILNFVSFCSV